jgi:hypothetical protein
LKFGQIGGAAMCAGNPSSMECDPQISRLAQRMAQEQPCTGAREATPMEHSISYLQSQTRKNRELLTSLVEILVLTDTKNASNTVPPPCGGTVSDVIRQCAVELENQNESMASLIEYVRNEVGSARLIRI